jgi:hypothetical protein
MQMKFSFTLFIILLLIPLFPVDAQQIEEKSFEAILKNVNAIQAMEIANEWKWSQKRIKSYVTARDVIFKLPDGEVKKVPLPGDKFLVAVAPYVKQTHK